MRENYSKVAGYTSGHSIQTIRVLANECGRNSTSDILVRLSVLEYNISFEIFV